MSTGLQALRAIIDNNSRSAMRQLRPELFMQGYEPGAYEFFSSFYRQHGALPSVQIMTENGFPMPLAVGPINYFLGRLTDRATYLAATSFVPLLDEAIKNHAVEDCARLFREATRAISTITGSQDTVRIQEVLQQVLEDAMRARETGNTTLTGVTLGFETFDTLTAGGQPGDVISVVARPNVGKSWTLIHMAKQAWQAGNSVVFVTMEMTSLQIARRVMGLATGLNPDNIRRGRITMWGEEILHDWVERTATMPSFHLMSGSFKKSTADIDRVIQEFQPDIAYIDAAYLVSPDKQQRANGARWERIYDVGEEIKGCAQDRNIPVVQSLQLSREKKKGVENDLGQIAGGDVIGQISTTVTFVEHGEGDYEKTQRRYELGKSREGQLGKWRTNFLFNPMNFDELPPPSEDEMRDQLRSMI